MKLGNETNAKGHGQWHCLLMGPPMFIEGASIWVRIADAGALTSMLGCELTAGSEGSRQAFY
jgi:hypothetical protein